MVEPLASDVEVEIVSPDESEKVTVTVPLKSTIAEVKAILAREIRRPEVLTDGKFIMLQPSGEKKPMVESQKLGPRRNLIFVGAPLSEPPLELPAATLEDFDPHDTEQIIESPRSLQACEVEGVDPEELFYAGHQSYTVGGLPERTRQLRHDFFEAYRQDTLNIVRESRHRLIGGEQLALQLPGNTIAELRAASPQAYPITNAFFEDVRSMLDAEKLYERPKQIPPHHLAKKAEGRWVLGRPIKNNDSEEEESDDWDEKPTNIISHLTSKDADLHLDEVEFASDIVLEKLSKLHQIPAGHGERVHGLTKGSQNLVGTQMHQNSQRLKKLHHQRKKMVKQQAEIAEQQKEKVDLHLDDILYLREFREKKDKKCKAPWTLPLQKENAAKARSREEHWLAKRDHVHIMQLEAEEERKGRMQNLVADQNIRQRRVANMRDLAQIHYTRTWTERRQRWGENHLAVSVGDEAYKAVTLHKSAQSAARVEDQRQRMQAFIDFNREYKMLRRAWSEMTAERERLKKEFRRNAINEDVRKQKENVARALPNSPARSTSTFNAEQKKVMAGWESKSLKRSTATRSEASKASPTKPKRHPRFNWGRFGAETLAHSSNSHALEPSSSWSPNPQLSSSMRSFSEPSFAGTQRTALAA